MEPAEFYEASSPNSILHCHHLHQNIFYDNSYNYIPLPPTPPSPSLNLNFYHEPEAHHQQFIPFQQRNYFEPYPLSFGFSNTLHQKTSFIRPPDEINYGVNSDNSCGNSPVSFPLDFDTSISFKQSKYHKETSNGCLQKTAQSSQNDRCFHEEVNTNSNEIEYFEDHRKIKYPQNENIEWSSVKFIEDNAVPVVEQDLTQPEEFNEDTFLSVSSPLQESDDAGIYFVIHIMIIEN